MSGNAIVQLQQALRSRDLAHLENAIRELERTHRDEAYTWYAKAELLRRKGDTAGAIGPSATALATLLGARVPTAPPQLQLHDLFAAAMASPPDRLAYAYAYLEQFGDLLERSGITHQLDESLDALSAPFTDPARTRAFTPTHARAAAYLLGFKSSCALSWGERVFARLIVPWMLAAAEARQFDTAIELERLAYEAHVKREESQAWFKATTGQWIPGLAQRTRRSAAGLGIAHARWHPERVRRIAFVLHAATLLAHVVVLLETLKAVREVGARDYDFTVFVLRGAHEEMRRSFEDAGAHVRYLGERGDESQFQGVLALQRILRDENFAVCFWVSLVALMAIAFPMRLAPLQAWWAMKYHACEIAEIDAHFAVENAVLRKTMEGIEWRTIGNASTRWTDPALEPRARELRAQFPADAIVTACIGREEKLNSEPFLQAICALLQRHPRMVFVWAGRARHAGIQAALERSGAVERTHFAGWVDTKLYAQAVDLFLDSFPFPCGFSLKEAMAAGKPVVMYRSPESLETGVPGAISSIVEHSASAATEARARLEAVFTRESPFDLYMCADSPQDYVEIASRLIDDRGLGAAAGAANRRYMEEFASSPRLEAQKFLDHLDELFHTIPRSA